MGFALQAIIGLFTGVTFGFGRTVLAIVTSILAVKAILFFLFYFVLPWVLFGVIMKLQTFVVVYFNTLIDNSGVSLTALQITGTGGYIASAIKLPEALSIYLSCIAVAFIIRFIPGIK